MSGFSKRIQGIRERVQRAAEKAGRDAEKIQILAVAKTAGPDDLKEAWDSGQNLFAHNRVDGLAEGRRMLPDAEWHMVGRLQGKMVRKAWKLMDGLHSFDRLDLGKKLDLAGSAFGGPPLKVWIQIQVFEGLHRSGCRLEDLGALGREFHGFPHLAAQGLMVMGPPPGSSPSPRRVFSMTRSEAQKLTAAGHLPPSPSLSMGMTSDLETAVAEGANLLRIGRALFPPC